ncbi:MAG: AAA family ATPase [Pseudonocardiaceae bacterium]
MDNERGPAPTAAWMERIVAEIVRGRHLIIHGNVRDPVRWRNRHVSLREALTEVLRLSGYTTTGYYDLVDGITSSHLDEQGPLDRLIEVPPTPVPPTPVPATPTPPPTPSGPPSGGPRSREQRNAMAQALRAAPRPSYDAPDDALPAIRRALGQAEAPVAFVVDFTELLLREPGHVERPDRRLLGIAKKAMLEAAQVGDLRNLLILIAHDLADVPEWLYRSEPFIQAVEATRPTFDERREFLWEIRGLFFADPEAEGMSTSDSIRVLANLTDGMATVEMDGLWRISRHERIGLAQPRELMNRMVLGRRQDPWRRLTGRVATADQDLSARVVGQPEATRRISRALAAATLGIDFVADAHSLEARPKGVFFFVGPTGVGKTELARALSELIYDDATALARFDMSTFTEPHSAERFTGAPPGYVGHERGGELTNRVQQRPFSLLLFDEIEKAHPSIFDKFLQILDDGRLTDGLGRTSYFAHTLIIFTSNLGAREIYEDIRKGEWLPYSEVVERFEEAVRQHFIEELNRPELLGRIGNGIVPFDILRPENIDLIARKFLNQLVATARRTAEVSVDEESVLAMVRRVMADPAELALGARSIRDTLDRAVKGPLVDCLIQDGSGCYQVRVPDGADIAEITRVTMTETGPGW